MISLLALRKSQPNGVIIITIDADANRQITQISSVAARMQIEKKTQQVLIGRINQKTVPRLPIKRKGVDALTEDRAADLIVITEAVKAGRTDRLRDHNSDEIAV
jgi:hypothetical protein